MSKCKFRYKLATTHIFFLIIGKFAADYDLKNINLMYLKDFFYFYCFRNLNLISKL